MDKIGGLKSNAAKMTKATKRSVYLLDLFIASFVKPHQFTASPLAIIFTFSTRSLVENGFVI